MNKRKNCCHETVEYNYKYSKNEFSLRALEQFFLYYQIETKRYALFGPLLT